MENTLHHSVWIAIFFLATCFGLNANAQTTIKGTVIDAETQEKLLSASVVVEGTGTGTVTDESGNFTLRVDQAPPFTLVISYVGYEQKKVRVTSGQQDLQIALQPSSLLGEGVVISASRRPEKIMEAPAAISIVRPEQITSDAVGNPFLSLRNVVGVDVGQAGVNSGMITLRGSSAVFQTETFVMADYRNLVLPGLGTLGYGQQPIDAIDLARIEVVKGPGSALYGPGVEAGVVHFISKDPFQYPGTTLSIGGGTRSAFDASFRHAGTNKSSKLGYKVLAFYRTAEDWHLDPNNPVDSAHLASFQDVVVSAITGQPIFTEVPDYDTESVGATGTLEFRPSSNTNITAVGGWSRGKFIFRTAQGEGYTTTPQSFGQVRLQSGGLFAQAYYSYYGGEDGNAGLYTTGLGTITKSHQLEAQLQYNFMALNDKVEFTVGSDYRQNDVDTERTVHGRFEEMDDYSIYGAYLQGDAALTSKLNFIFAGRVDRFTALNENSFSPRAGLVYKVNPNHSFRATYNRAVGAPTSINLFADLPLSIQPSYAVHLLGGANPITFTNDVTSSFFPGVGNYDGLGMPLAPVYGALTVGLAQSGLLPESLTNYLLSEAANIQGASMGVLTGPARGRDKLKLSQSNMFEIGYKGQFNNKLAITLDLYHNIRENMISAPFVASPLVVQPGLPTDLFAAVAATLDPEVLAQYNLTPEAVAGIYQNLITNIAFNPQTGRPNPLGVRSSDQAPDGPLPTVDITYYNISKIEYTGIDFGVEYLLAKNLSSFGSLSWLSQTFFEDVPVGEGENAAKTDFSLNVPDTKLKFGLNYMPQTGFNGSLTLRYQSEWQAVNGAPFTGPVDAFTVVDLGLGYRFSEKLSLSATATNIFNEDYRFIYGAPVIGRQVMARAIYNISSSKN